MLAKVDGVTGALANVLAELVLVELVLKSLRCQYRVHGHLSLTAAFEEGDSTLVVGEDKSCWVEVSL